jgi:transposase InsO family protein
MDDSEAGSLEQIRAFLAGSGEVRFAGQRREEVYGWVEKTLVRHQYASLGRPGKGLVRRYIARMTGLSRAQVTRLIAAYGNTGRVKAAAYQRARFATRYTTADVDLLAYVDKAHGNLSGPATRRILEREYTEYGQAAYQRLAAISVAHLYRLRNSQGYRKRNASYQPTKPTPIPIGERRKPQPHGSPGYLRIDTVHQGDQDGRKGLYHINAVDQVTQWEIVAAAPQISELWLMPVLEALLGQFPFVIRGFHSDNGSEFINYNVARLLDKLLIEQTKSRAHHSGDNGLVESKNGAIIRKHIGYGHIDAQHAQAMDQFHRQHLNRTSTSIGLALCPKSSPKPMASAAASTCAGPPRSSYSANYLAARITCDLTPRWRNWIASPKPSPIPKLPWTCNAPSAPFGRAFTATSAHDTHPARASRWSAIGCVYRSGVQKQKQNQNRNQKPS